MSTETTPTGLVLARLGHRYEGASFEITREAILQYADATNDANALYDDGATIPPVFPVRIIIDLLMTTLLDAPNGVNFAKLLHGTQDFVYYRALKVGDTVTTAAEIVGMEAKGSGDLYTCRYDVLLDGEIAVSTTSGFFIRGKKKPVDPNAPAKPKTTTPKAVEAPEPIGRAFEEATEVATDQPQRYADASGDQNPIHLDDDYAKMVGLGGVVLHGLCSMAFASRAVVQKACGGDPRLLKTLGLRFTDVVRPGDTITTSGRATESVVQFESTNQSGVKVLAKGYATLADQA